MAELPERFAPEVNEEEQTPARRMRRRVGWEELAGAVEQVRGESWERWVERHGDWARDGVKYVAVRHGGVRPLDVVRRLGMRDLAVAQGVKRFAHRLGDDAERKRSVAKLRSELSTL